MSNRRCSLVTIGAALAVAAPWVTFAQDTPPVLLTEPQAQCIAAQADDYIAENRPVYVVVIPPEDSCPNPPAGTQSLADHSTASGAGIGLKDGDSSGFIVMTQEQLSCLKTHLQDVLVPESSGKFRLVLEKCAE